MNISNEDVATDQIEKSFIAKPGSIINRFLIGNKESLQVENLIDSLKLYYEKNYSSNIMNLVLVGSHSLQTL